MPSDLVDRAHLESLGFEDSFDEGVMELEFADAEGSKVVLYADLNEQLLTIDDGLTLRVKTTEQLAKVLAVCMDKEMTAH